jgi:hypothetical protein
VQVCLSRPASQGCSGRSSRDTRAESWEVIQVADTQNVWVVYRYTVTTADSGSTPLLEIPEPHPATVAPFRFATSAPRRLGPSQLPAGRRCAAGSRRPCYRGKR